MSATYAQENHSAANISARIESNSVVESGKNIIFNSIVNEEFRNQQLKHRWGFGDETFSNEDEAVHVYNKPGRYMVDLEISNGRQSTTVSKSIFVYKKIISIINDQNDRNLGIQNLKNNAEKDGVFLKDLSSFSDFTKRNELLGKIIEERDSFNNSESIILWVDDVRLLGLLSDFQGEQKNILNLDGKTLVVITNFSFGNVRSVVINNFQDNFPSKIIITRPEAVDEIVSLEPDVAEAVIKERGYDISVITKEEITQLTPLNFFSSLINNAKRLGFPDDIILLFLILPIIILVVSIGKNLLGVTTVKIGIPILFILTLYFIGAAYGAGIFIFLYLINIFIQRWLKKYHLLPVAKSAITMTIVVFLLFITMLILATYGVMDFQKTPIYPFILLALFIDSVVNIQKRSTGRNVAVLIENVLLGLVGYWIITTTSVQLLILSHPEITLLVILLNIPVGKYTGLTLKEYFRFKDIIFKSEEE